MKKTFLKVALLSLTVAGATFVACNKEEKSAAEKGTSAANSVFSCLDAAYPDTEKAQKCASLVDTTQISIDATGAPNEYATAFLAQFLSNMEGITDKDKQAFFSKFIGLEEDDDNAALGQADAGKFLGCAVLAGENEDAIINCVKSNINNNKLLFSYTKIGDDVDIEPLNDYTEALVNTITQTLTSAGRGENVDDIIQLLYAYYSGAIL